jgi:exoribonuclease R
VDRYGLESCVALCAGEPVPDWVLSALPTLPETMRASARRASGYEREVVDLVEAVLLRDRVGQRFAGSVVDVEEKDASSGRVMVKEPAVEARLRSASGRSLPLGEDVEVELVAADPAQRRVRFELA